MVQYNKFVATDTGTYSIDYFTFDFLLLTTIRIFDLLILEIEKLKSSCIKYQHFQTSFFGNLKEVFQCDFLHIELSQNNFHLRLSFNPNHCINSDILAFLLRFVRSNCSVIAFRVYIGYHCWCYIRETIPSCRKHDSWNQICSWAENGIEDDFLPEEAVNVVYCAYVKKNVFYKSEVGGYTHENCNH